MKSESVEYMTLSGLCEKLSISAATGRNWVRLGKVEPSFVDADKGPMFESCYVDNLRRDIKSGRNTSLKSRRNKKYISGNGLYNSYVSSDCKSLESVQKLLDRVEESGIELDPSMIRAILADCARKLFADAGRPGEGAELISEMSPGDGVNGPFSDIKYYYQTNEDVLGLLYISCKNLGNRKATGAYYTPNKVVRKLVDALDISEDDRLLDPCCGTGNFLLQLPSDVKLENIYGNDLDPVSVMIARINLALRFKGADEETLREHITCGDYLVSDVGDSTSVEETGTIVAEKSRCNDAYHSGDKFDIILGNPPWGYDFTQERKSRLRSLYKTAAGKNIESFDVFIEQALSDLKEGGVLSFVLPEAILNVKAHRAVRKLIRSSCNISLIEYLGDAFAGVQCPSIIMNICNTGKELSTEGLVIRDGKRSFIIGTKREVSDECFSFNITDEEYSILRKMESLPNVQYLLHNADFALGIVTGNNKEFISNEKGPDNEPVVKGSDIDRYHIDDPSNYISFKPRQFQQVAPEALYRAKEKLFYRFISDKPVLAYDDKKLLSLNSCNIVIPHIEGLSVKYVMAVLNSSASQFFYVRQFASVKVLRSHLESIPIPMATPGQQKKIEALVDELIKGCDKEKTGDLNDRIDQLVLELFVLTEHEREVMTGGIR